MVRILSRLPPSRHCFTPAFYFLDFPELIPGTAIGTSRHGTSVYDSVISNTATSNTASDTAISNKTTSNTATPSSIGVHSSNVGTLAGGIVGGIVSISMIVSILFLYQRRRRLSSSTRDDGVFIPYFD